MSVTEWERERDGERERKREREREQFVTVEDGNHRTVSRLFGKNNIAAIFVAHLFDDFGVGVGVDDDDDVKARLLRCCSRLDAINFYGSSILYFSNDLLFD